jgi:hypothetical protein
VLVGCGKVLGSGTHMTVTRQAVQRVVNDLEAKLIRVLPNPDHRSSPLLDLTSDGRTSLNRITVGVRAFNASLTPATNHAQLAQARETLRNSHRSNDRRLRPAGQIRSWSGRQIDSAARPSGQPASTCSRRMSA